MSKNYPQDIGTLLGQGWINYQSQNFRISLSWIRPFLIGIEFLEISNFMFNKIWKWKQ